MIAKETSIPPDMSTSKTPIANTMVTERFLTISNAFCKVAKEGLIEATTTQ